MKHVVPHHLGQDKARKAADAALASYKERFAKYEPSATWQNERHADIMFRVKGVTLKGGLDINPDNIEMEIEVPLLFRPFKNKALDLIEREVTKWIAKAEAGEI